MRVNLQDLPLMSGMKRFRLLNFIVSAFRWFVLFPV